MIAKNNDIIKHDKLLILYVNLSEKQNISSDDFLKKYKEDSYKIRNTFYVRIALESKTPSKFYSDNELALDLDEEEFYFAIGELENNYYKIDSKVLDVGFDLYFYQDTKFNIKDFVAEQNISIFKHISNLDIKHSIYIGGQKDDLPHNSFYLSLEEFRHFVKNFPNTTEIKHYRDMRIAQLIREYFDISKDYEKEFQKYINKKSRPLKSTIAQENNKAINDYECHKHQFIKSTLEEMLEDNSYNEKAFQNKIHTTGILKLLFPKYVLVFKEASIKTKHKEIKKYERKSLDFLCVDTDGYVDIIELKLPYQSKNKLSNNCLRVMQYRNNYVPSSELSNSVMQLEKYIFTLSDNSSDNTDSLNERYKNELESLNLKIKISNPKGFLIIGRDVEEERKDDFELIKRHYRNIVDILTYDDLIRRSKVLAKSFE